MSEQLHREYEWLPDEYDPEASLADRLDVIPAIDVSCEFRARDPETEQETHIGQFQHVTDAPGTRRFAFGARPDNWQYEVTLNDRGVAVLHDVDPMQPIDAYQQTKTALAHDVDVRIYNVDTVVWE